MKPLSGSNSSSSSSSDSSFFSEEDEEINTSIKNKKRIKHDVILPPGFLDPLLPPDDEYSPTLDNNVQKLDCDQTCIQKRVYEDTELETLSISDLINLLKRESVYFEKVEKILISREEKVEKILLGMLKYVEDLEQDLRVYRDRECVELEETNEVLDEETDGGANGACSDQMIIDDDSLSCDKEKECVELGERKEHESKEIDTRNESDGGVSGPCLDQMEIEDDGSSCDQRVSKFSVGDSVCHSPAVGSGGGQAKDEVSGKERKIHESKDTKTQTESNGGGNGACSDQLKINDDSASCVEKVPKFASVDSICHSPVAGSGGGQVEDEVSDEERKKQEYKDTKTQTESHGDGNGASSDPLKINDDSSICDEKVPKFASVDSICHTPVAGSGGGQVEDEAFGEERKKPKDTKTETQSDGGGNGAYSGQLKINGDGLSCAEKVPKLSFVDSICHSSVARSVGGPVEDENRKKMKKKRKRNWNSNKMKKKIDSEGLDEKVDVKAKNKAVKKAVGAETQFLEKSCNKKKKKTNTVAASIVAPTYGLRQYMRTQMQNRPGSHNLIPPVSHRSAFRVISPDLPPGIGPRNSVTVPFGSCLGPAHPPEPGLWYPVAYPGRIINHRPTSHGFTPPEIKSSRGTFQTSVSSGAKVEGPPGANLYVSNIPQEFGGQELADAFQAFGRVLSTKVCYKATGVSKCYGFVSYDSPAASHAAIIRMNGCQLGGKALKVQLKRSNKHNRLTHND